jgi:hypothetical protein
MATSHPYVSLLKLRMNHIFFPLRDRIVDSIFTQRRLQEIHWHNLRDLSLLGPLSDRVEILAFVIGVEVHEGFRSRLISPLLSQDSRIRLVHKLLSNDVEAVSWI